MSLEEILENELKDTNIKGCLLTFSTTKGGCDVNIKYQDDSYNEYFVECNYWEFERAESHFMGTFIKFINYDSLLRLG